MKTVADSRAPLELFRRLTNGLYVVGVAHGEQRDGFTAAWLTQVSFDPLLVALSINPSHASFPLLVAAGTFAIFFPHDAHMPGLCVDGAPVDVKKIVMKVRV